MTDHGQGISPEFLPHVFERFRQEQSSARRGYGGLGLGLAIVHELVTAHGGTITVSSGGEGQGATFLVRLPRVFVAGTVADGTAQPIAAGLDLAGRRILVVEDNEDARALLQEVLGEMRGEVRGVGSVAQALEVLDTFDPHLLISDLAMPGSDGFDLIREVRERGWDARRLPAVALSAFAREEDRQRALDGGLPAPLRQATGPDGAADPAGGVAGAGRIRAGRCPDGPARQLTRTRSNFAAATCRLESAWLSYRFVWVDGRMTQQVAALRQRSRATPGAIRTRTAGRASAG